MIERVSLDGGGGKKEQRKREADNIALDRRGILGEVLFAAVLNVMIESDDRLPGISYASLFRRREEFQKLRYHRTRIVVCHYVLWRNANVITYPRMTISILKHLVS
jgi:hypothetical protein